MDDDELASFLGRGGTGVLALAREDTPYATPVSYGFDATARAFTLRLGLSEDSEKRRFLDRDAPPEARLVVYGSDDDVWTSVVATGTLQPVDAEDLTPAIAETLRGSDPPLLGAWEQPDDVEFRLYRLDVETLTGRRARGESAEDVSSDDDRTG